MAKKELSISLVILLLILTILVTMAGTWLTLTALTSARNTPRSQQTDTASVALTLIPPPDEDENLLEPDNGG